MEGSLLPLRHEEYDRVTLDNWEDVEALSKALTLAEKKPAKDGSLSITIGGRTFKGVKILVIDSLTEMNELCKAQILAHDRPEMILKRTKEERSTPNGIYVENLTQEDYGLLRSRMREYISAINHISVHTVWTANSTWNEDENTGITTRVPGLSGQLALDCVQFFHVVIHMDSENDGTKKWCTAKTPTALAKDSSGALEMYEPTRDENGVEGGWPNIFKKILVKPKPKQEK